MNIIDIVLAIFLILGAFAGFKRGFVLEIVSFFALFLGIIGGLHFLHWGISFLNEQFNITGKIVPILSFLMIFVGIIVLVSFLGKALKKVIHMTPLGGVDTIAGALVGAFKWAFMLSVIIWIGGLFSLSAPRHLTEESTLYSYVSGVAPGTVAFLSGILPTTSGLFDEIADMLSVFD